MSILKNHYKKGILSGPYGSLQIQIILGTKNHMYEVLYKSLSIKLYPIKHR